MKSKYSIKKELVENATARIILHVGDMAEAKKICIITNFWKDLDITYAHSLNVVNALDKKGIITTKKYGRVRAIKLTERGNFLYQYLWSIRKFFDEGK